MFCVKCGQQLPDDAAFCPKCGARTSTSSAKEAVPIRWEACTIKAAKVSRKAFNHKAKLWAEASGTNGTYIVKETDPFSWANNYNVDATEYPYGGGSYAISLLEGLNESLIRDGWEMVGTRGMYWYSYQFRRRIV